jgi:hypothetical protein
MHTMISCVKITSQTQKIISHIIHINQYPYCNKLHKNNISNIKVQLSNTNQYLYCDKLNKNNTLNTKTLVQSIHINQYNPNSI